MSTAVFVMLVLILWEIRGARKATESHESPPEPKERKPLFTPGAPWWEHVFEAIGIVIGIAIVLAISAVILLAVYLFL
jgi:hypothetical protein